jgi:RNA polymerase sigma-54 factor
MLGEIRRLDPKPALQFEHFVTQTMVPDVIMKVLPKSSGGGWAVELNSETLPRVLVNKTYYAEVRNVAKDKESKTFLNEHWQSANWLVKALDQRANTILKVSEEIIRKQEAFFLYGIEYLKPLVLRDVADAIGMHESTISRVTTSKFMATPRGVFELKYFFSSAINSADGAINYSSESVKAKIRSLIEQEDPKKVLSDAKLVALLNKDGVDVARRTVVKYREAMGIGSSVERRRQKNPKL